MRKYFRRLLERLRAGVPDWRAGTVGPRWIAGAPAHSCEPPGLTRAYCDLLDVPAARVRDRNLRVRRAVVAARGPGADEPISSRSSTRRRARSGTMCSRRSRRRCGATTSARRGSWAGSTSTSSCCSTSTGSSAAPTASTCCRSREELARPLVLTLHTVLSEPTDHQREVLTALCEEAERVIVMTETARALLLR